MTISVWVSFALLSCAHGSLLDSAKCNIVRKMQGTLIQDMCNQPLYVSHVKASGPWKDLDNVCFLISPPTREGIFLYYTGVTYQNGTKGQHLFAMRDITPGLFSVNGLALNGNVAILGHACNTSARLACDYVNGENFVFGVTPQYGELSDCCQEKVKEVYQAQGLGDKGWYALPMKLEANCPLIGSAHPVSTCSRLTNLVTPDSGC